MGLFGGGNSSTNTTNNTENNNTQFAAYEGGLAVNADRNSSITIDYLADDVAIRAFASVDNIASEVGIFAERSAEMTERIHAQNLQLVDNAIADARRNSQLVAAATAQASARVAQIADNSMADANERTNKAYQFADNAMADNQGMLDSAMDSISGVVKGSIEQSKEIAESVFNLGETVQSGTSTTSRNMNKFMAFAAMGLLGLVIMKGGKS